MDNKLMRYIRKNWKKIAIVIIIIVIVIVLVQILNDLAAEQLNSALPVNESVNQNVYKPNESVIFGTEIKEEVAVENNNLIDDFVKFCNDKEIEKAYEILSDECRTNEYPSIEEFNNNYLNKIFNSYRTYSLESWMSTSDLYTYRIEYTNNIMATGQYNSNESIMDYITIVRNDEGQTKLNINEYVGEKSINKEATKDDINVNVLKTDMYIPYEEYTIEITNNTNEDVLITDSRNNIGSIVIRTEEGVEYDAELNELVYSDVLVPAQNTKKVVLKFPREYNIARRVEKVIFKNITFENNEEKEPVWIEVSI